MQTILPRAASPDDGKPNHPDVMSEKDHLSDVLFTNLMRHMDTDSSLVSLSIDMERELAKNDGPQPVPMERHPFAAHVGLSTEGPNTASFGPYGGTAFMDFDGDVGAVWLGNLGGRQGVIMVTNGESVFLPWNLWIDMHKRLFNHAKGVTDPRGHKWYLDPEHTLDSDSQ